MSAAESPRLLIVEDDATALRQLRWTFDDYDLTMVNDRHQAVEALRERCFPVVIPDLGLPPDPDGISEGMAGLENIIEVSPDSKVIVVTGQNEHENERESEGEKKENGNEHEREGERNEVDKTSRTKA